MAPSNSPVYAKEEKVLCFHHELLYEAKVIELKHVDENDKKSPYEYKVHYKGWKATWDDWVNPDRMRKNTEENRELQQSLKREYDAQRKPPPVKAMTSSRKKAMGSDLSSGRGSEDRHSSVPAGGRGTKRGRENEIEKVSMESVPQVKKARTSKHQPMDANPYARTYKKRTRTNVAATPPSSPPTSPNPQHSSPSTIATSRKVRPSSRTLPQQPSSRTPGANDVGIASGSTRTGSSLAPVPTDATDLPYAVRKRIGCPCTNAGRYSKRDKHGQILKHIHGCKFVYDELDEDDWEPFCKLLPYYEDDLGALLEEHFHSKPSVRINVPDNLKSLLVDDWEYVTKNMQLVPLPSKTPVNMILDTYFDEEKGKRRLGSAEADLLEEVVIGSKEYFDRTLGKLLLYRFEREQYSEMRHTWDTSVEPKGPGDVYGAEHLIRMIVQMPEIIAQTNMDQQSTSRLREELTKLTNWLGKNSTKYFSVPYENATQEYIDKSRAN